MKSLLLFGLLATLLSCGNQTAKKRIHLEQKGAVDLIVMGAENSEEIKQQARALGISAEGDKILFLKGDAELISLLEINPQDNFEYLLDAPVEVTQDEAAIPNEAALYQAKKDFGIIDFWKKNPTFDGRGVTVGVVDDGISPHQAGFILNTDGTRKFLKKGSQSSYSTFDLVETEQGLEATIDEKRAHYSGVNLDLNANGSIDVWKVTVPKDSNKICVENKCVGSFGETGEYLLSKNQLYALMFELDLNNKKLKILQPERGDDAHGEGVASVMAGHRIGNIPGFDGVAPGASIVDYDLSEVSNLPEEREFTIGTILKALDWLGTNGAEVSNISYSLFFTSAATQNFMSKALDEIIKKHNMVVSFSAGNNGPGLGSLNRRAIYPNSALVAGAFISRELDEVVHGTTGLPEEGRVVYYSSRGPGLGTGPLLISPLSSLVNSTPDGGHAGFSGTSSASPALAGSAAVLISAIKQQGLKVDAETVVHALKLSGRRLQNEPFIFQGFGLPQMEKALEIYKELVEGKKPQDVRVTVDREPRDGVAARGIFLRKSENDKVVSRRISLSGTVSALASAEQRVNLLTPVTLEYSPGISGPRALWVSRSSSSFFADIAIEQVLNGKLEGFGEIKVLSSEDNTLLAVIPVTVIDDQNIGSGIARTFKLGPQEGLRLPLNITSETQAFRVRAEVLEGDSSRVLLSIFDNHHIRTLQQRLGADIWINSKAPGFYQVGISMTGGTARGAKVRIIVEPIKVELRTRTTRATEPTLTLSNRSVNLNSLIRLVPAPRLVDSVLLNSKDIATGATITQQLSEGNYQVELIPTQQYDLSYMYSSCSITEERPKGEIKLTSGTALKVGAQGTKATFRCMPFELGAKFETQLDWQMNLWQQGKTVDQRLDVLSGQSVSIKFPAVEKGRYQVQVVEPFQARALDLGEVTLQ